jgi:putative aldouronate transport system permease protein
MDLLKRNKMDFFTVINTVILVSAGLLCLFPFIHILAVSMSSNSAASANLVGLWPVEFNINSYIYVAERPDFWRATVVSAERVVLGITVNMLFTILMAYPLSKEANQFKRRTFYAWFLFITMLFNGGLIPFYMVVKQTGLMDNLLALVIPPAIPVFNIVLLLNFFRQLPKELEEAAFIDGAGHWTILWRIYVPTTTPALATLTLFTFLNHWNSWFDGLIFMNRPEGYPLQSYLRTIIIMPSVIQNSADWKIFASISDRTVKAAQIFLGSLPVMLIYPFLQKYFVKGIVLGSVKG